MHYLRCDGAPEYREKLPKCPTHCKDVIWTFFNEKWTAPPTEVRGVRESFQALDLDGDARLMPAGARLTDVRLGPGRSGQSSANPTLAAFQCDGQVYFGSADELIQKTDLIRG